MDRSIIIRDDQDGCLTPIVNMNLRRELQQAINRRNNLTSRSKMKCIKFLENSFEEEDQSRINLDFERRNNLRLQAIEEILTSERNYIAQLNKLITYFVNPLKTMDLIDLNAIQVLFGQLELIYNINTELLIRLEKDLDDVANAFLKLAPFFKIYSVYAFDFSSSLILLQNLSTKNASFREFLEKAESRPEVQQKLNALMITPIQRVPRYKLLLKQVLLYTSPANTDYKIIQESIKLIESTINHINSVVEDQENTSRLLNIQNSLTGKEPNILKSVSRKFIKEGTLFKYSSNGSMVKRYCILCSDIFMYCKLVKERSPVNAVENSLDCCCIFPLKKCKIVEIFAGKFKISCLSEEIILCSEDVHTGKNWIRAIKEAVELHVETRMTIRKDSSKRVPMRKKQVKKFEKFEADLLSPNYNKNNFDKIYYGQNISRCDDLENPVKPSFLRCFQAPSKIIKKRKHSESEAKVIAKKPSMLEFIGQKLGVSSKISDSDEFSRPILSCNRRNDHASSIKMRKLIDISQYLGQEVDDPPKKRVKFDEENLIFSSTTYQRQQEVVIPKASQDKKSKSLLEKFIDFTARLF